jgi:PAP2 superfamily
MIGALILSREGTITVPEAVPTYYGPALPAIDIEPKQLERWESWVRAFVAIGDMMQGITFETVPPQPPPPQPPILATGFRVLSSGNLIAEIGRPQAATFTAQIPMVLSWAELREERAVEILAQIDPQYAFWSSIVFLRPDRNRWTFELINLVLQFCVYVEMRFKHAFGCWRPVEYNAQVQPMITTPGHGSFPMGHATQAYAVAYVLKSLLNLFPQVNPPTDFPTVRDQLDRLTARITTNRVIAGVHFPVDSMAGRMLGTALGEYFVGRCLGGNRTFMNRTFIATGPNNAGIDNQPTTDFNPFNTTNPFVQDLDQGPFYSSAAGANIPKSALLGYFWDKAQEEWKNKFGVGP